MEILYFAVEKIRERPASAEIFASFTRNKVRNAKLSRNKEGSFLLDGTARSGNTFATFIVKNLVGCDSFLHHKHTVAALREASKNKLPLYILFRDPIDVVISNALYTSSRSREFCWPFSLIDRKSRFMVDYYLYRWIRYYRFSLSLNSAKFFSAEGVFNNPKALAQVIAGDLEVRLIEIEIDLNTDFFRRKAAQAERQHNTLGAGIPNEAKTTAKSQLRHVAGSSRYYSEASLLFDSLLRIASV